MFFSNLCGLALAGLAAAAPMVSKRGADCGLLGLGLNIDDCNYLNTLGFSNQGVNAGAANGNIWIGDDGPNTFTFTNTATGPIILVMWDDEAGYDSSFVTGTQPKLTYSLPTSNSTVTISIENGVSGALSLLNDFTTGISGIGQIDNTWAEFTTGDWATINVSREPQMNGALIDARVSTGCVANMDSCSFQCIDGTTTCGGLGTFDLFGCDPATNPNASYGTDPYTGDPSGGCMGWSNGGHIDISLGGY